MIKTDRHQLVTELIKSGLPEKPSEIIGKAFFSNNNLATKNNLELLENKLTFSIKELENKLGSKISDSENKLKIDISVIQQTMATKSDLGEMKSEILKYMLSFFLGVVALNVATIGIVVTYLTK